MPLTDSFLSKVHVQTPDLSKGLFKRKNCFVSKDQTESSFRQAFKDVGFSSKYFEDSFYCHVQNFNNIFYSIKDL